MAVDWPSRRQSKGKTSQLRMQERQDNRRTFRASVAAHQHSETKYNVGHGTHRASTAGIYNENASIWDYDERTGEIELTDRSITRRERVIRGNDPKLLVRSNPFAMPEDIKRETSRTHRIRTDQDTNRFNHQRTPQRKRFQPKATVWSQNALDKLNAEIIEKSAKTPDDITPQA